MKKTVIMLIGPKGSGKTRIGTVLGSRDEFTFLRVEPIWLQLPEGADGWSAVEDAVDSCLTDSDIVVIESLGGCAGFDRLRAHLKSKYSVKYVKVSAPLTVCAERVRKRCNVNHIPVSDDKVDEYNQIAAAVVLPWDLELVNDPPLSNQQIHESIKRIQQGAQPDAFGAGKLER